MRVRHLRQLRLLLVCKVVVPIVEAGDVLLGSADEEFDEVSLGLVVAVAEIVLVEEAHETILGTTEAKVHSVRVVLPTVVVVLLVRKLGSGGGSSDRGTLNA